MGELPSHTSTKRLEPKLLLLSKAVSKSGGYWISSPDSSGKHSKAFRLGYCICTSRSMLPASLKDPSAQRTRRYLLCPST